MNVEELIRILLQQNPEDKVVLWRWTQDCSTITHLTELCKHKKTKGFYEIGINEHIPEIGQEEWHSYPKEE